jgi:hypothetical protein
VTGLDYIEGIVGTQRRKLHEDTLDDLLDRLGNVREELMGIERSLERISATLEQGKDKPGKQ